MKPNGKTIRLRDLGLGDYFYFLNLPVSRRVVAIEKTTEEIKLTCSIGEGLGVVLNTFSISDIGSFRGSEVLKVSIAYKIFLDRMDILKMYTDLSFEYNSHRQTVSVLNYDIAILCKQKGIDCEGLPFGPI